MKSTSTLQVSTEPADRSLGYLVLSDITDRSSEPDDAPRAPSRRRQKQLRGGRGPAEEKLPLLARKPTGLLGVSGEQFHDALSAYVRDNPDGLLRPQVRP